MRWVTRIDRGGGCYLEQPVHAIDAKSAAEQRAAFEVSGLDSDAREWTIEVRSSEDSEAPWNAYAVRAVLQPTFLASRIRRAP